MRVGYFDVLGIPTTLSVVLVGIPLLLLLQSHLRFRKLLGMELSDEPRLKNRKQKSVALLSFLALLAGYFPIIDGEIKTPCRDSFGLHLREVIWNHQFGAGGSLHDFVGTVTYDALNTSPYNVGELFADDAVWFGDDFDYTIGGRVLSDSANRMLDPNSYEFHVAHARLPVTALEFSNQPKSSRLFWRPWIRPFLGPGGALRYEVQIRTSGTEAAAFEPRGSVAGMRTRYPAERLSMRLVAPMGFKIVYLDRLARSSSGGEIELASGDSEPEVLIGGSELGWAIAQPAPSVTYGVHFRFVRSSEPTT